MSAEETIDALLLRDSEMAKRLRGFDWASTPLGPPDHWPDPLRLAVGVCLNSRFPMFVWWGPQLINIYNDAYIPVLGKRHPRALGRRAEQLWHEIWPVLGPQAELVMRTGQATWNERVYLRMERNNFSEDTWFTWSYSPIPDGRGGIGGLFCACTEDTPRVQAENRVQFLARVDDTLRSLSDPQELTLAAATMLGQHLGADRCAYANVEPDQDTMNLTGNYRREESVADITGRLKFTDFGAEVLQLMRDNLPFVVNDIESHRPPVDKNPYRAAQVQAGICVPLHKDGKLVAAMAVHTRTPRVWKADEVEVVQQVASRCWESIERARVEGELRRSEERYRTLVNTASSVVWIADGTGAIVEENPSWQAFTGQTRQQYAGWGWLKAVHPEDRAHTTSVWTRALQSRGVYEARYRLCRYDRQYRRVIARAAPVIVEGGVLREWVGSCEDITDREQAEERAAAALESITDAFFAVDSEWRFTYVNRHAAELLGRQDLLGKNVWDEFPPMLGTEFETIYRRVAAERISATLTAFYADHKRWYQVNVYPAVEGLSVYFRDVTEMVRAERQREEILEAERQARSEAERVGRMKDEFLATLSHELRTPLNAITGWTQLLRRGGLRTEDVQQAIEVIARNAEAQTRLIEDLLDMSRITSGKVRLELKLVDPAEVVEGALESVRPTAEAKGVRLLRVLDTHAGPVQGDPNRLQQVVWNLLTNAVKFTPRGGRVQVTLARVDSHAEITVSDTGVGIATDFLPLVFDRFAQADAATTRHYGGLGLGLSIVKQLVEMHNGQVSAHSDGDGRGATFSVRLPLAAVEAGAVIPVPADEDDETDHPKLNGLKVVAVDDEPDARELIYRILVGAGATVIGAGDATEALGLIERERPDVVVSDIGMPHVDGYEFVRRMRALGRQKGGGVPAVAVTAFARPEDRRRALLAGYQSYVTKPMEAPELVAVVASLTGRAGVRSE